MGPRPGGRGEARTSRGCACEVRGFNGAAPRRARRGGMAQPAFGHRVASMGPRPGGRGEKKIWVGKIHNFIRFNGAAPRRARRGVFLYDSAHTKASFNGAAPRRARRVLVRKNCGIPKRGFNGAAPRRARRVRSLRERLRGGDASMGPRPGGRGEGPLRRIFISTVAASMGPRPGGRGESLYLEARPSSPCSFNGAAPRRARRVAHPRRWASQRESLQWGRAPEGAERAANLPPRNRPRCFNGAAPRRARRGESLKT